MDCYVYYKTAQEHELHIVQRVRMIREYLNTQMNINLRLQRQPGADNGVITWMEIYRGVPVAFAIALADAVSQSEILSLIQGQRHAEFFEDANSCA
jgi:hypothetical protein